MLTTEYYCREEARNPHCDHRDILTSSISRGAVEDVCGALDEGAKVRLDRVFLSAKEPQNLRVASRVSPNHKNLYENLQPTTELSST